MYVAFKWLTALAFAMWLGLCCLDMYLMDYKTSIFLSTASTTCKDDFKLNNDSAIKPEKNKNGTTNWNKHHNYRHPGVALQQYLIFLTGAFAVLVYSKRNSLIPYFKKNVGKVAQSLDNYFSSENFKIAARTCVATQYWNILRTTVTKYVSKVAKTCEKEQNINLSLLKRLKDLSQERKALGQLLMAAIQENKNIRRQYQLEASTKNKLLRQVQNTHNLIKESRSRYVDFQQLYLVTEKENCYLKQNIKKLRDERDHTEKNLMELINRVYQSKNNDLKAYCAWFIVHTKKNLLNSEDVNEEISKFLQKSSNPSTTVRMLNQTEDTSMDLSNGPITSRITEILEDDYNPISLISNGPRLRGLPGEYVWTVKDKNGIIEKLYEYNHETDYDNGDTIRRIREYSVYHDKDCLLDHRNLGSTIPTYPSLSASATRIRLDIKSLSSQGSLANFLLKKNPLRLPPSVETLPLSCPTNYL